MSCGGPLQFADGGVMNNPIVMGGKSYDQELNAPKVNGGLTLDEVAKKNLFDAMAEQLRDQVLNIVAEAVNGIFRNSEGNPLSLGSRLMTKAETEALMLSTIASQFEARLHNCEGNPLPARSKVATCTDLTTAVTLLEEHMERRICEGCGEGSSSTPSTPGGGIDMNIGAAPGTHATEEVPFTYYGGVETFLGKPTAWGAVTISGVNYRVPLFLAGA